MVVYNGITTVVSEPYGQFVTVAGHFVTVPVDVVYTVEVVRMSLLVVVGRTKVSLIVVLEPVGVSLIMVVGTEDVVSVRVKVVDGAAVVELFP